MRTAPYSKLRAPERLYKVLSFMWDRKGTRVFPTKLNPPFTDKKNPF
jgi:hypothetical protein